MIKFTKKIFTHKAATGFANQQETEKAISTAPYPAPAIAWGNVGVLFSLYTLSFVDRNLLLLFAVVIAKDLSLTDSQIGILSGAAFAACYAIATLPLGWAIDRYSRRFIIWCGITIWSLATMTCGLSRTFEMLFFARALVGTGEAVLIPGSQSILPDVFPPERLTLPMSVFALGAKVGGGLSFILGGALAMLIPVSHVYTLPVVGTLMGWQLIFIVAGLPGLILTLIIFAMPEPERRHTRKEQDKGTTFSVYFRYIARNIKFYLPHHGGIVVLMIVVNAVMTWTPIYFSRSFGWKPGDIGLWLGIALAVGPLIGIPLHGTAADTMFRRGRADAHLFYLKIMLFAATIPAALVYLVSSPWLALGLLCVSQALLAGYIGILPATLQLMVPGDLRGKAASIAALVGGLGGMAVGPSLIPFLTEHVFHDQSKLGLALVISVVLLLPGTAILLACAQKPMAQRLAR